MSMQVTSSTAASLPSQLLIAGAAVSSACLAYHLINRAVQQTPQWKAGTIVVLSGTASISTHLMGASAKKSAALAALVFVALSALELTKRKPTSTPPPLPPWTDPGELPPLLTERPATPPAAATRVNEQPRQPSPPPSPTLFPSPEPVRPATPPPVETTLAAPAAEQPRQPSPPPSPTLFPSPGQTPSPEPSPMPPVNYAQALSLAGVYDEEEEEDPVPEQAEVLQGTLRFFGMLEEEAVDESEIVVSNEELEVLDTETTFLQKMQEYNTKLQAQEKNGSTLLRNIEEMIKVSEQLISFIHENGVPAAYKDEKLMRRYFNALEAMIHNMRTAEPLSALPMQRGPRHELLLRELVKIDPSLNEALEKISQMLISINNAPQVSQLLDLHNALTELTAREKKGERMKLRFVFGTTSMFNVYTVDVRPKRLFRKAARESLSNTDQQINDSKLVLDGILNFLGAVPKAQPEVITHLPLCIKLLKDSKWWESVAKKDKTLTVKLNGLTS